MDFKEIDAMFEGAFQRLGAKANPAAPYGEPPLASDHFLLKRGWEYFRQRAAAMEAQWKQILGAKDDEIKALKEQLRLRDERLTSLEGDTRESDDIEQAFVRQQLAEQRQFSDDTRKLYDTWEEEREALIRSVEESTARVQRIRAEAEHRLKSAEKEVENIRVSLDKARAEIGHQADKRVVSDADSSRGLLARDEVIRSMESKIDLLRSELDRREMGLKDHSERTETLQRDLDEAARLGAAQASELGRKSERIQLLEETVAAVRREADALRASWKNEQAEWRELWDRSREMWGKKRGAPGFPSEPEGK